ncbi:MAG: FISUMP domain-containing protein [Dysgonomonas sp.]|nr:FISUMP domain-containing protein [Dysgonomonas sp.]
MKPKRIITLLTLLFIMLTGQAQVTIGSSANPNKATLLDLNENTGTDANGIPLSSRGLGLPRVKLTDHNNLFPMFESTVTPGSPNDKYNNPAKKADLDAQHIGLLVHNMNTCNGFTSGSYVWTGDRWEQMSTANDAMPMPAITVSVTGAVSDACYKTEWDATTSTLLVHIPSGYDMRTLQNPYTVKLDWTPTALALNKVTPSTLPVRTDDDNTNDDRYARGGITFSSNPPSGWTGATGGSATYTFGAGAMDGLNIGYKEDDSGWYIYNGTRIQNTPWRSRQTTLEFVTTKDICEQSDTLKVVLNQTNFHLWVKRNEDKGDDRLFRRVKEGTTYFRYLIRPFFEDEHTIWDGNFLIFKTESNAWWKTKVIRYPSFDDIISDLDMPENQRNYGLNWGQGEYLLGQTPKEQKSVPKRTGVNAPDYIWGAGEYTGFGYTGIPDRQSRMAARITFQDDWDCVRYPDVTYDIVQCSANYDTQGIENGSSSDPSTWGDKVLSHTDQDGNVFYSALFGTDRWMITNLAATSYADNNSLQIDPSDPSKGTLSPLTTSTLNLYDKSIGPRFAYSLASSNETDVYYEWGSKTQALTETQGYTGYYKRWYPEYGVFYNWYAATRQPSVLDDHLYNEGQTTPLDDTPGPIEVETTQTNGYIQGICPNGWHLPSDREWNRLERHVYNQVRSKQFGQTQYDDDDKLKIDADLAANIYPEWNPAGASTDWETATDYLVRGYDVSEGSGYNPGHIGHGGALKSVCPPTNLQQAWMISTKGYSAEIKDGGFNAIPIGRMVAGDMIAEITKFQQEYYQGSMSLDEYMDLYVSKDPTKRSRDDWNVMLNDYGYDSAFWSSSASGPHTGWMRNITRDNTQVGKEAFFMNYLISVRCVKNK